MKNGSNEYDQFISYFSKIVKKNPNILTQTVSNIMEFRNIGAKTHGDIAEVALSSFIHHYLSDNYDSIHVGKKLFRCKEHEEDIKIINMIKKSNFFVSIKTYGDGPLQLSTDKNNCIFPFLSSFGIDEIKDQGVIHKTLESDEFAEIRNLNILSIIYDEIDKRYNIMVYDYQKAAKNVCAIRKITKGNRRKHPVFIFLDKNDEYIFEVRYGNASANALQRGVWTQTKRAKKYFSSVTNGWLSTFDNPYFMDTFSKFILADVTSHAEASKIFSDNILSQKCLLESV